MNFRNVLVGGALAAIKAFIVGGTAAAFLAPATQIQRTQQLLGQIND